MATLYPQLRYLGTISKPEHSEYGFQIENPDKTVRLLVLTIANSVFLTRQLMVQEAPDLCYQKVLAVGRQNLVANEFRPSQSQIERDSENLFAGQQRYVQELVSREVRPVVSVMVVLIVRTPLPTSRFDSKICSGSLLPIVAMMQAVNSRK